jgi:hypothetical protein
MGNPIPRDDTIKLGRMCHPLNTIRRFGETRERADGPLEREVG